MPRLFRKGSFALWKYLPVLGRYISWFFSKRDLSIFSLVIFWKISLSKIFSWSLVFAFGKALDQGHYQKWAHMSLILVGPSFGNALNLRHYPKRKLLTESCEVK
jgi:hypothetical protein